MDDLVRRRVEDGIAILTLDRPPVNAMDGALLGALDDALARAADDPAVDGVVLAGANGIFSAGADIRFLNAAAPLAVRDLARLAVRVTRRIEALGKVAIAAIEGHALGGGLEIAEACWLRVAAGDAWLGHPEVRIGAVAGFGGTTRLARLIGKGRAAEMLLTGRVIDAQEALSLGLLNRLVPAGAAASAAVALAREIAARPEPAVRLNWEAMHRGLDMTIDGSAELGADSFGLVAASPEFRDGTSAFLAERAADT